MEKKKVSKRVSANKKRKMILLGAALLIVVLLIFAGSWWTLYQYVHKTASNEICEGVYIGAVDVSGLTRKEAISKVSEAAKGYQNIKVIFEAEGTQVQATLGELGFTMEGIEKQVDSAVKVGKRGNLWRRYRQLKQTQKKPRKLQVEYAVEEAATETVLNERVQPLYKHAENASIKRENGAFQITEETIGKKVNVQATIEQLEAQLNGDWEQTDVSMHAVEEQEVPQITAELLGTIQDELGSYKTAAGSGKRVQNLVRGAELLNGSVMMPGEELSVAGKTSPYTLDNGYVVATGYENGKVVPSIGGGICQVSTTMYNAALYAELEITERFPHSMTVNYVKPSRDAAIAGNYKDLKFKNNYDTPIYIEAYINGANELVCVIYGKETRSDSRVVEFESEVLQTTEPTVKYQVSESGELGAMSRQGGSYQGKKARLWKVVKENGEEISRDVINSSTYRPSDVVVTVGVRSDNAEASKIVRNAVASNNQAQIESAIAQAKAKIEADKKAEEEKAAQEQASKEQEAAQAVQGAENTTAQ